MQRQGRSLWGVRPQWVFTLNHTNLSLNHMNLKHYKCTKYLSVYQKMYHIEALMQRTKFSFYWSCTVTPDSICVCSDIEVWASGCLPEVKNKIKN